MAVTRVRQREIVEVPFDICLINPNFTPRFFASSQEIIIFAQV